MSGGPMGPGPLLELADAALSVPGADAVEARVAHRWGGLARFAHSAIHQHVATEDVTVAVRVAVGRRVGGASTNAAHPQGATEAARRALAAARATPPDPGFPGLAGPAGIEPPPGRYDEATASASPTRRAEAVSALLGRLRPGQAGAGAVETSAWELAHATTAGARHWAAATRASASTVIMAAGASGHAENAGPGLAGLDPGEVGGRAAATCAAAVDPEPVEPGQWDVVLLPSAVATLVDFLADAFSAKAHAEGRSALVERMGQSVTSPLVSLADDALADGAVGLPFDGEGTPRLRVDLLAEGVACGLVHDRATAAAAGVASTGHGRPGPNPWGPVAGHLVLAPGASSVEALVAGLDRGLLVTRFWYTRTVNERRSVVTGMTRDGTFLVEDGEVGPPVRNLRYNQSILEALAGCDGVGDALRTCFDEGGDTRVPALRLRGFTFTSRTDH